MRLFIPDAIDIFLLIKISYLRYKWVCTIKIMNKNRGKLIFIRNDSRACNVKIKN